jgi:ABC-type glycerol-3-phosphate transport system substrate-binding protein
MGRTTRSKLTATALSALAAGSVIGIGMATTTASAASPVSFTYWTSAWGASEIATLDSQFDAANPGYKANGEYIAQSDEYLPKVIAAIKSGTYPTVLVDQNPSDLPLLEQSGKLLPLNSDLTSLTNALYPGIKASLFYRGEQLGMALAEEGDIALFYNKTDFAQAGIPVPPSNWSQLAADAIKLTVPSAKRWGFYVPTGDAEWISYDWEPVLWGNGGSLLNASQTKATFDSAAGVSALATWVNLVRTEKAAPTASFETGGNYDAPTAFTSNAVAMITDGPWLEGDIPSSLNYGVAPYPSGTKGPSTNIGILVTALFKTTPAQDAAGVPFIKWLASPKEAAYLAETSGGLPSSPAQLSQPLLKQDEAKKWYSVFSGEEQFGQVRPITPAYTAVSTDLWTEINAAIAGKVTPSQALATAAKEADQALASS